MARSLSNSREAAQPLRVCRRFASVAASRLSPLRVKLN
jgi:hypothetical protein